MICYKNISHSVKTFYGQQFKPRETHEVPGYINSSGMIRVKDMPKEPPKANKGKSQPKSTTEKAVVEADKQVKPIEEGKKEENPNGTDNNQ